MNDPRLRKTNTYTTITHIQNTLVRMRSPPLARSCSLYTHTHTLTRTCSPALIRTRAPCALMLKHAHHTTAHVRVLSEWVYDILGIRGICGNHDDRVAGDGRA